MWVQLLQKKVAAAVGRHRKRLVRQAFSDHDCAQLTTTQLRAETGKYWRSTRADLEVTFDAYQGGDAWSNVEKAIRTELFGMFKGFCPALTAAIRKTHLLLSHCTVTQTINQIPLPFSGPCASDCPQRRVFAHS